MVSLRLPGCRGRLRALRAFTLIELLVVLAIVALLLSISVPRYLRSVDASREAVLAENLRTVRETLDKFYGDQGRYPESLEELVEKRYLRSLPQDPITESTGTWILVPPDNGARGRVYEIWSGAPGTSRSGKPYGEM